MGIIDNQIGGVQRNWWQHTFPAQKIASNTLVLVIANHEFDFDKTWILEMFHQRRLKNLSDSLTQKIVLLWNWVFEYYSVKVLLKETFFKRNKKVQWMVCLLQKRFSIAVV